MSDHLAPPTAAQALYALKNISPWNELSYDTRKEIGVLRDFIHHHSGCHEREAGLVLTIEEQERDIPLPDMDDPIPHETRGG